ncbi:MAG: hypothetical protein Q8P24_10370 [Desulfobacterales bacterium]|nr:hypothetical protein [Desulfobacterales bacterium]
MIDLIKKTMLIGVGLALRTKDEAEKLAQDLINQGGLTEKEGQIFMSDLLKKYEETSAGLESRVNQSIREYMKKMDLVTGADLKEIKKEIRELKKAIGQ